MSTYSLVGSGTQALTAETGALRVHVTTIPGLATNGRAFPLNLYDIGLIRQGDGTDWWRAEAIDAEHMLIPLLRGITQIGYALLHGATIDVTEVIGTSPFYPAPLSPTSAIVDSFEVSRVTDLALTAAYADVLTHDCAAGDWVLSAELEFSIASQSQIGMQLTDGTNIFATGSDTKRVGFDTGHLHVTTGLVTLASPLTVHMQSRDSAGVATVRAAVVNYGGGNHATRLTGLRFA